VRDAATAKTRSEINFRAAAGKRSRRAGLHRRRSSRKSAASRLSVADDGEKLTTGGSNFKTVLTKQKFTN
jgi:hypothetical protein